MSDENELTEGEKRAAALRNLATWEDNVAKGAADLERRRSDLIHYEQCHLKDIARRDDARMELYALYAELAPPSPAQPVHPDAELRDAPPAASEESGDQNMREEIAAERAAIAEGCEQLGYEAFGNGVSFEDNPHRSPNTRQHWARGWCEAQRMVGEHSSDCSLHNLPAFEPLPCNCGGYDATLPTADDVRGILSDEDWTPTVQPAELTVADLDKLATKASPEERAEAERDWRGDYVPTADGGVEYSPEIPEGFTKWEGGECPVEADDEVAIIRRDGTVETGKMISGWMHSRHSSLKGPVTLSYDIIAYRILEAPAPEQDASVEVLDATELPQVTIDKVPPTAEVIRDQEGRAKFALFDGQTREVVSGSGNPDADFWANVLHPKPKVDA